MFSFSFCEVSNFYAVKSIIPVFSHFLPLYCISYFQPKLHKLIILIQCDQQYSTVGCPISTVWRHKKGGQLKWAEGARLTYFIIIYPKSLEECLTHNRLPINIH